MKFNTSRAKEQRNSFKQKGDCGCGCGGDCGDAKKEEATPVAATTSAPKTGGCGCGK